MNPTHENTSDAFIQVSRHGHSARVTLHRPELHNAFNAEMIRQIHEAFQSLGGDPSVRAIVLAAEGKSFSAGADLNWMRAMVDYTLEANVADATALAEMLQAIRHCPKPVIARVQGAAYGGGVGLVAVCDMAVALDSAMFCLSEAKLGLIPAVISPFVLEKIGSAHARRYFLTAEAFSAVEAKRLGLVCDTFTTPNEIDGWIDAVVESLSRNGPEAVMACKALIDDVAGVADASVHALTTRRIAERRTAPEGQEGMRAFLEKRPPHWVSAP